MKLIEIKKDKHYIIVDDSEIKEGDFVYDTEAKYIRQLIHKHNKTDFDVKITHSTQPLVIEWKGKTPLHMDNYYKIKSLSLSEVEEAIYGYSVEKMAETYKNKKGSIPSTELEDEIFKLGYKDGFKAHKELVKDKLFTIEEMKKELLAISTEIATKDGELSNYSPANIFKWIENRIKSLQPKTEWDVEFDEQGKLK